VVKEYEELNFYSPSVPKCHITGRSFKGKIILAQAMKAQRGSRSIALLFL
jgi:hypothetical protein